ncbi:cysteine desulfurase [Candidatus Uhrbacteria bacterium CG10_big_fil_rev_8_21_14_0_10_48_11]|uniref:cysteine desulfurase n=1 Tax=Candidatus Uhrbacteria bacterium CG10_big_fil_rev_8_21_14_0_10_48_11 TaxID=1975037 RepID=A0A2M8LF64_9BACT|nr:MAG: cysteine desulfurase [Candidatus Uhrbacteria bacterium CG10_big_fil_rev_8_21_14_0_10_48_11]
MPNKNSREDFPLLQTQQGKNLAYLDSAATTLKPESVIAALDQHYRSGLGTAHQALYTLGEESTRTYEMARHSILEAVGGSTEDELIFTASATASINMVAESFGRTHFFPGDNIVVSVLEHHANFVPWQRIGKERGVELRVIAITPDGELDLDHARRLIDGKTKLVAVTHASNVIGTVLPVKTISTIAHNVGAVTLVDGTQAIAHLPINVEKIGADFYVASAHKCYGPNGIGFLLGKKSLLQTMPPYQAGGRMVNRVTLKKTTYADLPQRFEPGTPNVAGAVGFAAALTYLKTEQDKGAIAKETALTNDAIAALTSMSGVKLIGSPKERIGVISFAINEVHPHDFAAVASEAGVAVRAGDHCAQPLMDALWLNGTIRISFGTYSQSSDITALVEAIHRAQKLFSI